MTFAFSWTPQQFAACNGQLMPVAQNQALYSLLGTQFGGDGRVNFGVPDLRGRVPAHFGQPAGGSNHPFAQPFGMEYMTLSQQQLPPHNHTIQETAAGQTVAATATATVNASTAQGTMNKPQNTAYWAKGFDVADSSMITNYTDTKNSTMASDAVQVTVTPSFNAANLATGTAGSASAFPLAQPSLALNFCICTAGIYPSRT
jgi:microcystin-dependent protein